MIIYGKYANLHRTFLWHVVMVLGHHFSLLKLKVSESSSWMLSLGFPQGQLPPTGHQGVSITILLPIKGQSHVLSFF
jgi:hypothetical protein